MFPYLRGVRIAQVTDGTSQTLFVGERGIVFDGVNTHGWWTWGAATTIATTQPFQPGSYEDPAAIVVIPIRRAILLRHNRKRRSKP